ncbi:MAG: metal ABC transporter solute-binding protein, Zn/Mn family, partial [Acidimicrobiales bacterium]
AMAAALQQVSPDDAAYFDVQAARLETEDLRTYDETVARIRAAHAGTPIAVTESVFEGMAAALGLRVLTPPSFAEALAEGGEPTARDKEEVDRQIAERQVKVLVYNAQNATPDVRTLVDAATARAIPVTTVTESLSPPGAAFQDWQVRQLLELEAALSAAPRQ